MGPSAEQSRFFFQPVEFDLEPTDLAVEFVLERLVVFLGFRASAGERVLEVPQGLLFPLGHLGGMDLVTGGNLVGGEFAP